MKSVSCCTKLYCCCECHRRLQLVHARLVLGKMPRGWGWKGCGSLSHLCKETMTLNSDVGELVTPADLVFQNLRQMSTLSHSGSLIPVKRGTRADTRGIVPPQHPAGTGSRY